MAVRNSGPSGQKGFPADVPYFDPLFGHRLRPNARMQIEHHRECGLLLNHVALATEGRRGASEPVKFVFNTLDAWVMREYGRAELDMETLAGLYCPGPPLKSEGPLSLNGLIERLERVKCILVASYPLGLRLQELLREIDRAIGSISKWDGMSRGKVYREPVPGSEVRLRRRA